MRKLFKDLRKGRAPTPPLQTPNPSLTANPLPAQSVPAAQGSISAAGPAVDLALQLAIQKHLDGLPEADRDAFREESKQMSQDSLLSKIKAFDDDHRSSSSFRPRAKVISKFLELLNRFMAGICTAIQANPDPSSIVVGAVQVAIGLALQIVTFFDRLTDMLSNFSDYLAALATYTEASDGSNLITGSVANVYGDLLKFFSAARQVFVDHKGAKRQWISVRAFLRVQWEPFEAVFGDIERKFNHHLNVLSHSAEASQLNTLRHLEKTQNSELHLLPTILWMLFC
jgi:ABC-type multidrug transport system fused ATPase/permease subunit